MTGVVPRLLHEELFNSLPSEGMNRIMLSTESHHKALGLGVKGWSGVMLGVQRHLEANLVGKARSAAKLSAAGN